jgi:ferrous iron transport protein B
MSNASDILREAEELRWQLGPHFQDEIAGEVSREASALAARHVQAKGDNARVGWQRRLDLVLTGRWTGIPAMALLFALVLWITIEGANVPSGMLASVLVDTIHPWLKAHALAIGFWPWLAGFLIDGMYLSCAWVVSVMLPPMAIFFPLFTLLEDFGYLPRVAFNLDRIFQKAGAHGKQALTMTMGLGCNAAGVVATRIIDSPRERLIAILTNNFSLCNGRWPTQILMATVFVGALAPPAFSGFVAAGAVFFVAVLGFACALGASWLLSRTVLKGEASSFSLELPPYRPPNILRTLYTSLLDRTLFVLWRAVVFALPAGAVIWLIANVNADGHSIAWWMVAGLDPLAWVMGLTGVILVAYIVAIPANEIVVPTILMLTVLLTGSSVADAPGAGVMFETEDHILHGLLTGAGWTTLTAVCLMLFSLLHNPCSTTLYTIYKETGSWRWTFLSAAMPLALGFVACSAVAFVWRALAGS